MALLESHSLKLDSLHEDVKNIVGDSSSISKAVETLQNQTSTLLTEARMILARQSFPLSTRPNVELRNGNASKDEDVPMTDQTPPAGVPSYQKPSVEQIKEEHYQAKHQGQASKHSPLSEHAKFDSGPSTNYHSSIRSPPIDPTTPKPKRKYADEVATTELPPPSTKKIKRHLSPDGDQEPEFFPTIQLEDVTEEVDARIRAKDEMRAREKARLQDMNPKRKSEPIDSTWIQDGRDHDDPNKERRKKIRVG